MIAVIIVALFPFVVWAVLDTMRRDNERNTVTVHAGNIDEVLPSSAPRVEPEAVEPEGRPRAAWHNVDCRCRVCGGE